MIIGSNKLAWAFPTNIPITEGHTLVVPVRCVGRFEELTEDERRALEELRYQITEALKSAFGAEGFNFAWNDGEVAGQSVPHLHLHIVPRKKGDTGIHNYDPRKFLYRTGDRPETPEEELSQVALRIKKALDLTSLSQDT